MSSVRNPILLGFNPDPSIVRVGGDYYIATSTFEWYPGVQIFHSTDLVNWDLVKRPLDRASQLDMRGEPDSCGVWAPCLTHADGQFWLVYSDVRRSEFSFKDVVNYVVTAPSIDGPWSDPVRLNASGFDPSMFHDVDGRKWVVNQAWDYRPGNDPFDGIALQEYSVAQQRLVGPITNIFDGTALGCTEGPHLYRHAGADGELWYYLLTAEGGTSYEHAVTVCRSRTIEGPYEVHPEGQILTARHHLDGPLQKAGHGDLVDTPDGTTFLVHLTGRPVPGTNRCILGRESAIQRVEWRDDWPWVVAGPAPSLDVELPWEATARALPTETVYRFDGGPLPIDFQWLRSPEPERLFSTTAAPGALRLFGRESLGSSFEQALVGRRLDDFNADAETVLHYQPEGYRHLAGLAAYYGRCSTYLLGVSGDGAGGRTLQIIESTDFPQGHLASPVDPIALPATGALRLVASIRGAELQFGYGVDGDDPTPFGPVLDASVLSDECAGAPGGSFTGTFFAMVACDLTGTAHPADFSEFVYRRHS